MEVGLTVTDLEKSRAFYRDFVGLEELPVVKDALLGVMKYPFRLGETTVNVWSFGPTPRANTRTAGIQYVISDVEAVDVKAKAQAVKIDTPLGISAPVCGRSGCQILTGSPTTSRRSSATLPHRP